MRDSRELLSGCHGGDARAAERGSAYLFVLLGLLVLTIIGLSLVVVTQTEAQIGGAEKSATRILFGADSGLHAQVGLHFIKKEPLEGQFTLDDQTLDFGSTTASTPMVVDVSPFYPIYAGPCALCSVNEGSDQRYYANNYVVNAAARRFGPEGCTGTPLASKLLSSMYLIQPEPEAGGGITVPLMEYEPGDGTVTPEMLMSTIECVKGLQDVFY